MILFWFFCLLVFGICGFSVSVPDWFRFWFWMFSWCLCAQGRILRGLWFGYFVVRVVCDFGLGFTLGWSVRCWNLLILILSAFDF